jgi:hypothetical protein
MRPLRALALFVVLGAACKESRQVGLDITLPRELVDTTVWFEIGAFKDASCDALNPMLANGVPEGSTARLAFRRTEPSSPKFGDIPNGRYAFGAVARSDDCTVLALGCTEEDVNEADSIVVAMSASREPTGKCAEGATCQAAKCLPANNNSDPSVGAGCSLELLGAGPLLAAVGGSGTALSAPAIGVTPTGFVVVYRESEPGGIAARITIMPIDFSGGAFPFAGEAERPIQKGLPKPCADANETDGVGLVVDGEDAMMALAKPPCEGNSPELQLVTFKTAPTPEIAKFLVSVSPTGVRVTLGSSKAAAMRTTGALVTFTEGGVGRIANMDPVHGIIAPNGSFGGSSGITDTWIAANEKVLALLAAGKGDGTAPSSEAGAPAGESTLRLLMLPPNTGIDTINAQTSSPRAPIVFPGEFASIAALGGRVLVMSDGTGPGRSVTYRAFDLSSDSPADTNGFSVDGDGKVTAGDVALAGDRAYFATLKEGGISLHVFANATTKLTPLRSVLFAREPRISAINTVRDGRVAVAATENRVAVTWTTAKILGSNDPTGGYAVFGCTP